jgi:hypothetical protein
MIRIAQKVAKEFVGADRAKASARLKSGRRRPRLDLPRRPRHTGQDRAGHRGHARSRV